MNILFETRDTGDTKALDEYYRYMYISAPRNIVRFVLAGILATIAVLVCVVESIYETVNTSTILLVYVLMIYAVLVVIIRTAAYKNLKKSLGYRETEVARIETVSGVTDEGVFSSSITGASCSAPFSSITFAYSGKSAVFLQSKGSILYVFAKDAFVVGTADEMVQYLRGKGIKVKE